MRIRTFLFSATAGLTLFTAVAGVVLYQTYDRLAQSHAGTRYAGQIVTAVFELNALASEYLRNERARPRRQWEIRHQSMVDLLAPLPDLYGQEGAESRLLRRDMERLGVVFRQLADEYTLEQIAESSSSTPEMWRRRLITDFRRTSQDTVAAATVMAHNAATIQASAERRAIIVQISFAIGLTGIVAGIWLVFTRKVLRQIHLLQTGIEAFESGNLGHRVGLQSDDEIGQAAQAFDRMAGEVQRSQDELEQFAYVASHDLQEPLRMVGSYTELLAKRYQGQLDDRADKYIGYAVAGANRMQALINDLLAYSRIGTRGRPFEPTDCGGVVDEAVGNLKRSIDASGARVIRGALPTVRADRSQLVQVFQNLIANAIRYRREERPRIEIDAERSGPAWTFSVRDNGIGIDPEFVDRIFVIFQRLHARSETDGNGIGLAIVKKVVERHGGRIWVRSKPGHGSTFLFTLGRTDQGGQLV